MSTGNRWLMFGLGAIVATLLVWQMFRSDQRAQTGPSGLGGTTAPVFAMRDAQGADTSLAAYRGKVVVMNLWASWCPPCRAEMPDLQRFEAAYQRYGVEVVGVNEGESAQRASAFAKSLRISFPIWIDADQQYGRLYAALGLPTTIVIGPDGLVKKGFDGPLTYPQMESAVAAYVRKR